MSINREMHPHTPPCQMMAYGAYLDSASHREGCLNYTHGEYRVEGQGQRGDGPQRQRLQSDDDHL